MNVIKGVLGAVKEDKVNEWLKDHDRKVKLEIPTKDLIETIVMTYDNEMAKKADDSKVKIVIEVSNLSVIEKMIEFLKGNTDECYTKDIPYPPSEGYSEFLESLESTYKAGVKSNDK